MDHHTNHHHYSGQGFNHNEGNNHPYYQPRNPMNRAKSHEDVCLQRMVGLREQHSKSTQQLMTQLNLAKELVKERVVIKESAKRRESSSDENVTQNYSASADEVQQMRRQNRLGKTSLTAMKYLSSVDHRRSSSLLGVNTIIHKKKPVNCSENIQYCQNVEEDIHGVPLEDESSQPPTQKTIVVNINEKLKTGAKRSATQSNLLHQHSSSELKKI
ncbi:predicted protein [Naegleria gruberi]|uniref:Predicted protein n=1 Tax=Naegleria gruberi TaxID=5762 RepID=D2W2A4_NAEGR|nr:uncharacterized protein NAEGRDRAFT_54146 [Naegleria gruberi]EFC36790.1 predicted protein [Naegleria gruberi]|eukprot:XP_002669534.1 predicted protein [Naegleria gruberi strain NEG-M]